MSKLQDCLDLIYKKISYMQPVKTWVDLQLSRAVIHLYTECDEKIRLKYDDYVEVTHDSINRFRGTCFDGLFLTDSAEIEKDEIMLHDQNETLESLAWILLHELGHVHVNKYYESDALNILHWITALNSLNVCKRYNDNSYTTLYNTYDNVHEERPVEIFCNMIATSIMDKNMDRVWWNNQKEHKIETITKENELK